jgi:hypothetical protein
MSAYLCADDTFDFLASAALRYGRGCRLGAAQPGMPDVPALLAAGVLAGERATIRPDETETIAQILRAENVRSLRIRYQNRADELIGAPRYAYRSVRSDLLDAVAVIKSCDCLEYQSCEADDYRETLAYQVLSAIRRAAMRALPRYEDAPWGWVRPVRVA